VNGPNNWHRCIVPGYGVVGGGGTQYRNPAKDRNATPKRSEGTIYAAIWQALLMISVDPFPEAAQSAKTVVDYIHQVLFESSLGPNAQLLIDDILRASLKSFNLKLSLETISDVKKRPESTSGASISRESYFTTSLRRSASIAASLKNLALGYSNNNPNASNRPDFANSTKVGRFVNGIVDKDPDWNRPPDVNDYSNTSSSYRSAKEPSSRNFQPRDQSKPPTIPIPSKFLEWSIEVVYYFYFFL
jgi:regulator-associated protein of mTOR